MRVGPGSRFQECARAVLLTPDGRVLLMKIKGWARELWITPGGRIRPHEQPIEAVTRELREETGRSDFVIEGSIWVRRGTFVHEGGRIDEREVFYLVRTEAFEPTTEGFEPEEVRQHLGFRWWSIAEIESSDEFFVPRRIAEFLAALRRDGAPPQALDVSDQGSFEVG